MLERSDGDGFTVQDVADEAGQSLRTLYQYFESKDDLLLAVFEEAMRTYARMIRDAVVDLSDPLDRLAGAMIAAVRMPEFSDSGVDRGLARLRLKLGEVKPELVARSQEPVTALFTELMVEAAAADRIRVADPEEATYMVSALRSTFITSLTLGNDLGVRLPTVHTLTVVLSRGPRSVARRRLVRHDQWSAPPARTADHPRSNQPQAHPPNRDASIGVLVLMSVDTSRAFC